MKPVRFLVRLLYPSTSPLFLLISTFVFLLEFNVFPLPSQAQVNQLLLLLSNKQDPYVQKQYIKIQKSISKAKDLCDRGL